MAKEPSENHDQPPRKGISKDEILALLINAAVVLAIFAVSVSIIVRMYSWDVVKSAWDSTQDNILMKDFLFLVVGIVIIDFLKKRDFSFSKKYTDLPFFETEPKRWLAVFVILFCWNVFVVVPHRLFINYKQQNSTLNEQVSAYEVESNLAEYRIFSFLDGKPFNVQLAEIANAAGIEFNKNHYKEAVLAYDKAFRLQADERSQSWGGGGFPDETYAQQWPLYLVSILKDKYKRAENPQTKAEACNDFIASLSEKTNKIQTLVDEKQSSTYFSHKVTILTSIDYLKRAEAIAPNEVTNAINNAIKTLTEESKNAVEDF